MIYLLPFAVVMFAYLALQVHLRDRHLSAIDTMMREERAGFLAQVERMTRFHLDKMEAQAVRAEKERQLLANRIQDPQFAVGQAAAMAMTPEPSKPYVGFEDDQDYWKSQREMVGE